jgi:hypothetical protein
LAVIDLLADGAAFTAADGGRYDSRSRRADCALC